MHAFIDDETRLIEPFTTVPRWLNVVQGDRPAAIDGLADQSVYRMRSV